MKANSKDVFNLTGLLRRWKWPRVARPNSADREYKDLLRYTLQIAAEREIAAGVLVELWELLEENAPAWYRQEQHQRVESALELLQRL